MINKIAGKRFSAEVKQLQTDDKEITSVTDIADTLAETFSEISFTSHYGETFQLHKATAERQTLKFKSNSTEKDNTPFSMDELLDSLSKSSDTAVGQDDIHYQMLKHLPSWVLHYLLNTLNNIWLTGYFPASWRQSSYQYLNQTKTQRTQPTIVQLPLPAVYAK